MYKQKSLFLIDGIAPFFISENFEEAQTINWSKIPFSALEKDGAFQSHIIPLIKKRFNSYIKQVASVGYNAITLDDVAHLVPMELYPHELNAKIELYQDLYGHLFSIASHHNLKIFITTDFVFTNTYIEQYTQLNDIMLIHFLGKVFRRLFQRFPGISGIIFRLGECDGLDVEGDFCSKLILKTPLQVRQYIKALLPLFEKYDRSMIVRTWTVGAYPIGDLIWNQQTYDCAFKGIESEHFIISQKFGVTDFYRYLELNPLLFDKDHKVIVELQARREYEGFGEFPSFVGYDYEKYAQELKNCPNVTGISVWCQTGGWSHFFRITFLDNSSFWNELNTYVSIKIFKEGMSAEKAATQFYAHRLPGKNPADFIELLQKSEFVMKNIWYLPSFSEQHIYFRRIRVPPLLWIFWDTIIINHTLKRVIRRFVRDRKEMIRQGYRSLYRIREMKALAERIGLGTNDIEFLYDTCSIIAMAREYFLGKWSQELGIQIERKTRLYRQKHPGGFNIEYDFSMLRVRKSIMKTILRVCVRFDHSYRFIDRFLVVHGIGMVYPLLKKWHSKKLPSFSNKQAMGIEILFK